ncbi:MAG: hypothetical protein NTV81_00575, partial [Candidatus Komeilibacteria bacterium]|nr:hypothetical protein [Candidatus Komeilibacteria bacterium]
MKRFFALLLLGTLIFGLGSNAVWAATMSEKTSTEAPVAIAPLPPIALPLSTDVLVPSSEKSFSSLDALLSVPIIPTPEAIAPLVFPATTNFADPIIPELGVSAAKAVNNDEVIADPLEPQRDSELPRGVGQQAWRTMGNSGPGQYNFLQNFTGSFATDLFTGAATFQYPLWVPAGRLGLTPAVTLSYSTNEAKFDSFAGYGWSFPTNAIYRSTRHGSDQLFERNDFTANISGNSQELIVVNQQAGLYGAKLESSFVKYEFSNNYWLATDTKGNQYTFGASDETRQTDPENNAHVYKWLLERVEDRNGNFITYTYFHDRGQVYPETIRYTGHGDDPGLFEVRFIRKGRPNITSYERGFEVETRFIVDRVNVYSYQTNQAVEVMSYRFSHEERNNAIVHLRSIQAQAANDQAAIMPPVTFSYYDGAEQEAGKKNNFLKEVVFPYGARQTFFYSPAATQRLAGGGLANHLPFTVFTLSESRLYPTPNGEAQVTQYNYEGGYYYFDRQDAFKKEYAGFHIVTVIDPAGNVGKTYFHSKKGKVYREEQYDNAGHLFQKTIQTWDKLALADDDADVERFFVFLRQEVTSDYDGNQDNKSRASAYQYDAYGNVTRQTDFGDATLLNERGDFQDIGQDRSEVITDYALNEEAYIVALPSHAIKKDFLQNTVGEERFYYDGLGLGQVERGNITRQETRMLPDGGDPGLIWNISRQEYNAYGLPIRSVNPRGFAMQISYDQWNLYPVLTTNARGQVTQSTYDLVFGMPTIVTDPNGARQVTILDGLGRVRSKLVSNPAGGPDILTTSYNYQLENYPRSIQVARHFWPGALVVDQWTYLDGLGREIQTRSKMEEADQYSVVNKFYDVQGNLLKETLPLFGNGTGFSAQNINDTGNLYAYDALSRLVSVTNP